MHMCLRSGTWSAHISETEAPILDSTVPEVHGKELLQGVFTTLADSLPP